MNKIIKLLRLKSRLAHIKAKGKYFYSPGVYNKVSRQIITLEKELNM